MGIVFGSGRIESLGFKESIALFETGFGRKLTETERAIFHGGWNDRWLYAGSKVGLEGALTSFEFGGIGRKLTKTEREIFKAGWDARYFYMTSKGYW